MYHKETETIMSPKIMGLNPSQVDNTKNSFFKRARSIEYNDLTLVRQVSASTVTLHCQFIQTEIKGLFQFIATLFFLVLLSIISISNNNIVNSRSRNSR